MCEGKGRIIRLGRRGKVNGAEGGELRGGVAVVL